MLHNVRGISNVLNQLPNRQGFSFAQELVWTSRRLQLRVISLSLHPVSLSFWAYIYNYNLQVLFSRIRESFSEASENLGQTITRDGDRFKKKKKQPVRWHGRLHSTSTLFRSRFNAISCNWYVPIQSPALAAKKRCFQQPFMKTKDFSNVAPAFTPWMQRWRDF